MEGLNNAADSSAYSCVKYAPINSRRFSLNGVSVSKWRRTASNRLRKNSRGLWCRPWNSSKTSCNSESTSASESVAKRAMMRSFRSSPGGSKGRKTTRLLFGDSTISVRSICMDDARRLHLFGVILRQRRFRRLKRGDGILQQLHLGQRKQERQG